jgi:hypothetical protein
MQWMGFGLFLFDRNFRAGSMLMERAYGTGTDAIDGERVVRVWS